MKNYFKKYFAYIQKENYDQKIFEGLVCIIAIIAAMLWIIAPTSHIVSNEKLKNIWCGDQWTYDSGESLPKSRNYSFVTLHTDAKISVLQTTVKTPLEPCQYLCFRTMSKYVRLFQNDSVIFSEYIDTEYEPFKPLSYHMYQIPLEGIQKGDILRLELMPPYKDFIIQYFCIGDRYEISQFILSKSTETIIVCVFVLFLILLICTVYISPALTESITGTRAMFWLAAFLVLSIVWMLTECGFLELYCTHYSTLYFLCNLCVFLMPVPFIQYTKHYFFPYAIILDLLSTINMLIVTLALICYFLNVFSLWYTYIAIHILIIVSIASYLFLVFKEGHFPPVLVTIGLLFLFVGVLASIYSHWKHLSYPTSSYFGYGIIVYSICMLIWTIHAGVQDKKLRHDFEKERLKNEKENAILASEQKSRFLSHMSHEIRTPINAVLGMNELILRESTDENILHYAGNINQAGKTLLCLVNDILDLSKIESGKMDIIPVDYSLASVIHDTVTMLQVRAKDKDLELILDIDPSIPENLHGDEIRVKQIITNFLINAVKYTKKGWVKLSIHYEKIKENNAVTGKYLLQDKIMLIIDVSDSGIGIKEEDLSKLFQNFERLDTLKNRTIEGTGLGLSITSQLVKLMHGTIDVSSVYGEGSCFTARIPQETNDNTPIGDYQKRFDEYLKEETEEKKEILSFTGYKILLADDNELNLEVISALLEMMDIEIETAPNGAIALNKLRTNKYDLILTDDMMPEMSGTELMQALKNGEAPLNSPTPILVVTANAVQGMREDYLSKGFDEYLTKPIDIKTLQSTLSLFIGKNE